MYANKTIKILFSAFIILAHYPETDVTIVSLAGDNGVREDLQQALEEVTTQCYRFWSVDVFNKTHIWWDIEKSHWRFLYKVEPILLLYY